MPRFVGEITLFGGDFAPNGWLLCDGSTVLVADYRSLFEIIGTTYGGDGVTDFALPDMGGKYIICCSGCVPTETEPAWGPLPLPEISSPVYEGRANEEMLAGGQFVFAHGLGVTPTRMIGQPVGPNAHFATWKTADETEATFYVFAHDGTPVAEFTSVQLNWIAL